MTLTWEDVRVWCEEFSAWITEIGQEEEFKVAHPKADLPLTPDQEKEDLQDDIDILGYLTLWMTCKIRNLPPTGLHNRMILCDSFSAHSPWQGLYSRVVQKITDRQEYADIDVCRLFYLAS